MRNMSPEMMLLLLLLQVGGSIPGTGAAPSLSTDQLDTGQDWLSRFGYLPPPDPVSGQLQTQEALTRAIRAMQRFAGLKETGLLDRATLVLMKTPRCSLPDESEGTRFLRKRSLLGPNRWKKRHLSWRIRTFPLDRSSLGVDLVRALMFYALKVWSDVAPLDFHEVSGSDADIQIDFAKNQHQDGFPFDGPGGAVAHAFYPGGGVGAGDTHFDDDEDWTFRQTASQGLDLFSVAVHEFGHSLGLLHSSAPGSIMRPYYQGPVGDPLQYQLPLQDRVRVWQLYGVRESVSPPPLGPQTSEEPSVFLEVPQNRTRPQLAADVPDRCSTHFDAVAQIRGEAFFFKGQYFWRLTRDKHLVSVVPVRIQRFWRGLPSDLDRLDAVYERPDHKIVFFKGLKYWVFKDNMVEEGFPRPITELGLAAQSVDAALVCPEDDVTYLFQTHLCWRFDERLGRVDDGAALWTGLPAPPLDDATRWSDGSSYFFKGREYWRVIGSGMEAESGPPRPIAQDWLLCPPMQADAPPPPPGTETRAEGRRRPDHAENGYEVCSCTSGGARTPPPPPLGILLLLLLLPSLR